MNKNVYHPNFLQIRDSVVQYCFETASFEIVGYLFHANTTPKVIPLPFPAFLIDASRTFKNVCKSILIYGDPM